MIRSSTAMQQRVSDLGRRPSRSARGAESAHAPSDLSTAYAGLQLSKLSLHAPTIQPFSGVAAADNQYEAEAHQVSDALAGGEGPAGPIHRMPSGAAGLRGVHPAVRSAIAGARAGGAQLPDAVRSSVGGQLGADLSGVRIHTDERADMLNRGLNARAFTTGRDIFFRKGEYNPSSAQGQGVLNHELTHVVQQCGTGAGGGAASEAPIQRFVLQLDKDDDVDTMSRAILRANPSEGFVQANAIWAADAKAYRPTKRKKWSLTGATKVDHKLKRVPLDEPLRVVGHGSYAGLVGGYSAQGLLDMLVYLGLPKAHTGGIDLHCCLPAFSAGGTRKPTVAVLQDLLTEEGYAEKVRGYANCVFPQKSGDHYEVSSAAYHYWTKTVARFERFGSGSSLKLTDEEQQEIRTLFGEKGEEILQKYTYKWDRSSVSDVLRFRMALDETFKSSSHYLAKARLRRASSVRL